MVAQHDVVAGTDGSPASLAAVEWAAADAVRRGRPLRILYAYTWPPLYAPIAVPVLPPDDPSAQEDTARVLAAAVMRARAAAPGVELTTAASVEPAANALRHAGRDACEVVVGSRGHGGFAGLLLGSVGVQVAAHAPCPVVVVRHGDPPPGPAAGRIVVGVDGSPGAGGALEFAFEQASGRGAGLTAVLAYRWPVVERPDELLPRTFDAADLAEEEPRTLAECIAGWRERCPDVDVRTEAVSGRAAEVLVTYSAGAELLVVGSRGRGGFAGLLLGSVSQAAIHHAACPVAVVRPHREEAS